MLPTQPMLLPPKYVSSPKISPQNNENANDNLIGSLCTLALFYSGLQLRAMNGFDQGQVLVLCVNLPQTSLESRHE
jgi:hypothetical protein